MGCMPYHFPGYMLVDEPGNASKWEAAWNIEPGGLNRQRGLTTTEILSNARPGGVRSLYIMGENPMMSEPNLNSTRHHMEQLEFLVAQDLFINESGAFADVFLPAASGLKKKALSPTPTGACSASARRSPHAANRVPIGRSSAILPGASRRAWAVRTRRTGNISTQPRSWKKWAA